MRIQQYSDYRRLIRERLQQREFAGKGQIDRLAKALGVAASQVSQVLSGRRELTLEQACNAAKFLKFNELESEYFVGLVQLQRTSSVELRKVVQKQLARILGELESTEEDQSFRAQDFTITDADRGTFYSQWYYSAVRLLTEIPGMDTSEKISARLGLPIPKVNLALEFLLRTGLCMKKEGKIGLGPSRTYTQRGSPFHGRHHLNWRVKAMEYLTREQPDGLSYTAVVSLSREEAQKIRQILFEATERAESLIDSVLPQSLYCLSMDWFEL